MAADILWLASRVAGSAPSPIPSGSPEPPPLTEPPDPQPPQAIPRAEPQTAIDHDTVGALFPTAEATAAPKTAEQTPEPDRPPAVSRAITLAARPLQSKVSSPHRAPVLNEEATAQQAARDGLWLPVVDEAQERLLDTDIVLDDGRFAMIHRDVMRGFMTALTDVGAFRSQRVHLMNTDVEAGEVLHLRTGSVASTPVLATSLVKPEGTRRRLIIVVTDGVGNAWHNKTAQRLLARWGEGSTVCVAQVLPPPLWRHTGIKTARTRLRNSVRAGANKGYHPTRHRSDAIHIPVIATTPEQVQPWAEFVMGKRPTWRGAAMVCSPDDTASDLARTDADLSAEQRVQRFRMDVTATAFQLAVHLAAAPLSLPLIRLVQRKLLPGSTEAHLAELMGSGLVQPAEPQGEGLPVVGDIPYDFRPGVRQELLMAGQRSDTARVLMTVVDHLGSEIRELRELRQVIIAPHTAPVPDLPEELALLLGPTVAGLEAMAGPYSGPARQLKISLGNPTDAVDTEPRSDRELLPPKEDVYQHVAKNPPVQDPFGVTVNMRNTPTARPRQPHEPIPVWNVPSRNTVFTGREDLLAMLDEKLQSGTTAVLPQALHGLGGVGKSQIAIEYCYRHQEDYDLIWWISSERLPLVRQAYVDLATHLELEVSEPTVAVPAVREALRLGRPYGKWLLVFDNAEDVDEIQKFFPTNGPGKIIVTSRSRDWLRPHVNGLEVDVFRREESRELLRRRGPELTDEEADEIAERLGDLPLAIEQAAVLLAETGMPVSDYLRLFDSKRTELLRMEGSAMPVAVAWNISFERLKATDPAALQLLQVCANLAPEPIPRNLFTANRALEGPLQLVDALRDPYKVGRLIRAIGQYSLCKVNHRDQTISLHRLVQRVVANQMHEEDSAQARHCAHLLLANANPKSPRDRSRWPEYRAILPHVQASNVESCDDSWARDLCLDVIDYLYLWGDNDGYREMAQRTADTWRQHQKLGPTHQATLDAELRLGRALNRFADFEGAYEIHRHVRDTLRDTLGPDDERTLEAEGFLSTALRFLGRFNEALDIDQRAHETLLRRLGPDDPATLEQAHLLAIDWRLTGNPGKAKELDADTLRRKEEVLGPESLSTQSTRAALVIDELESGNYLEALRLQEIHSTAMIALYGKSHPGAMDSIGLLSVAKRKAGLHEEAFELSKEALALFRARYGDKYQSTVANSLNHAVNLRHIGKYSESVEVGQRARESYEELFGPGHPNAPTADVNVAVSLRLMERFDDAYRLDKEAMESFLQSLGPDHPRTLVCAVNIASDLYELGQYDQALARDHDTLARLTRAQGTDHPTTLACAHNLGLDLRALGQESEASEILQKTFVTYGQVLGKNHPAYTSAARGDRANCDIYPIPL